MAGKRLAALSLPVAVVITAFAIWVPTGTPRFTAPPAGHYTVLGARIDVDVAIYALLDDGKGEPRYFKLPYSTSQANALQQAMDGSPDGQSVQAIVGQDGGVSYDGSSPVTGLPPKQAEQPAVSIP
jgi:hypothetical protein